jgi:hypothetical protein
MGHSIIYSVIIFCVVNIKYNDSEWWQVYITSILVLKCGAMKSRLTLRIWQSNR